MKAKVFIWSGNLTTLWWYNQPEQTVDGFKSCVCCFDKKFQGSVTILRVFLASVKLGILLAQRCTINIGRHTL